MVLETECFRRVIKLVHQVRSNDAHGISFRIECQRLTPGAKIERLIIGSLVEDFATGLLRL